jgi:hypothetical protein
MPYSITRHAEDLIWVEMDGHLALPQAECYFVEMWSILDESAHPLDLLVDGRRIAGAAPGARRRTEQIVHHPNMGHLAFVVGEYHLLIFAPLVKLVSGIGLFGNEHEAINYLYASRGRPLPEDILPNLPPHPDADLHHHDLHHHDLHHHDLHHPPFPPQPSVSQMVASAEHAPKHRQRALGATRVMVRPMPPLPASRQKQTPLFPSFDGQSAGDGTGD